MRNQHSDNTKNNHFVPKFYLKNFLNSDGLLYMKDKTNNKIYTKKVSELKKIASRKNLYSIEDKISKEDVLFFKRLSTIDKKPINSIDEKKLDRYLYILVHFLNGDFGKIFHMQYTADQKIEAQLGPVDKFSFQIA